jgi:L-ascorbate metabolism protein UlaG (beta-lactamase superfamily)
MKTSSGLPPIHEDLFNETYIFVAPNQPAIPMKVTYYGHSCFMLETGGSKLLFDPYISLNEKAKHIDIESIKPDYVMVTHAHGDHVADVETLCKQSGALLVANYEIVNWFQAKGINKVHPMNLGGTKEWSFGKVKMVHAAHSSSFPDGTYGGNPGGYVISSEGRNYYIAGDTALYMDMKLIAEEFEITAAFLPIGDNFTMGPEDACKAAQFVNTKKIVGIHYDTFPSIVIDKKKAQDLAKSKGLELLLPEIGQTIQI